jgi:hypothetical protein
VESNSTGIKSLSGSCDVQIEDKAGYKLYISTDEGSFRFFKDLEKVSCDLISEGSYINCSDKEPEDVKPKDQGFIKTLKKLWILQIQLVVQEVWIFHLETCSNQNSKSY